MSLSMQSIYSPAPLKWRMTQWRGERQGVKEKACQFFCQEIRKVFEQLESRNPEEGMVSFGGLYVGDV